jgi:predicted lipoprotein with Yx(FWY)xxD motif
MQKIRHQKGGAGDVVRLGAMTHIVAVLTLTAVLGVIGFLAAGSVARSATQTNTTISLRNTKLGPILMNSRGHTLYLFLKDRNGKSACSGSCARFWPPCSAKASRPQAPASNGRYSARPGAATAACR